MQYHHLFNDKDRKIFEGLCRQSEQSALAAMNQLIKKYYTKVQSTPKFIVAYGDIPVALVAHADTVFARPPRQFFYDTQKNVIWSPDGMGADDRAGLFAIYKIIKDYNLRPHIIITTGEESGCVGAFKLSNKIKFTKPLNFMIELDRRGKKDSVYYDCGNDEFEKYINNFGFITAIGSFTDISILAPAYDVAAVNFSVGYEHEHSEIEHLYVDVLYSTIEKTAAILQDVCINNKNKIYKYIERPSYSTGISYSYGFPMDDEYEYYDGGSALPESLNNLYTIGKNDICKCDLCAYDTERSKMLQINFKQHTPILICEDCYLESFKEISECTKCHKLWFEPRKENWMCYKCKQEAAINVSRDN